MLRKNLPELLQEVRACRLCVNALPHGPRPVIRASTTARLMICGQAPGTLVHQSGLPFDDPSGRRLRQWLDMTPEVFYDAARVAIVPMGFCYPGRDRNGADLPPRPECAATWHGQIFAMMPQVELTLLIGQYAQAYHLGARRQRNMTETVRAWRDYWPCYLPLPHPSWRNNGWLRKNPWFTADILPRLRSAVAKLMMHGDAP